MIDSLTAEKKIAIIGKQPREHHGAIIQSFWR